MIKNAIIESKKKWIDMWSMMAENDVKDFDSIKATPGMEFWRLYEILQKKLENKNNKAK